MTDDSCLFRPLTWIRSRKGSRTDVGTTVAAVLGINFLRHCLRRKRPGAINSIYLEGDDDVLVTTRGTVDSGPMALKVRSGLMLAWLDGSSETHRGPGMSEGPATRQSGSKAPTSIDSPNEASANFTHSSRSAIGPDAAASTEKKRRRASNMMTLCLRAKSRRGRVRHCGDKCNTAVGNQTPIQHTLERQFETRSV